MPTYVYECDSCAFQFDREQKFTDKPVKRCPKCKKKVHRVIQPAEIVFKGEGWTKKGT